MNAYSKKPKLYRGGKTESGSYFLWQKILVKMGILVFLILLLNIFQAEVKDSFYIISAPVAKNLAKTSNNLSSLLEPFLSSKNLKQENDDLKNENQKLLLEFSLLKENSREEQTLEEVFNSTKGDNFEMVLTKIIGLDASYDFILIDKGSDDGIFENMPVISSQKVLYGKVFKAYQNFSQVMLISSKDSVVDVKVQSDDPAKNSVYGAVKGEGNFSAYLDLIDLNAQIKENDYLITSGLEGVFPRNLLVGKIRSVDKDDLKPFQTAEISLFFEVKNIENLFVVTNYLRK